MIKGNESPEDIVGYIKAKGYQIEDEYFKSKLSGYVPEDKWWEFFTKQSPSDWLLGK